MCMSTAFTDDPGYTDILIDRFSVDDINDGSGIGSMIFVVAGGMADGAFLRLKLKRSHEIKK